MSKSNLRKITHTAVIIAVTLALRNFSFLVPFAGAGGMRIDASVFFSKLPALLFGPLFGGISDGIIDLLAYIIKPEGAYLFPLTLTAILGGIIAGFLWKSIKNINTAVFRKIFITLFSVIGIWGIINLISANLFPDLSYSAFLLSFGKRTEYLTVWFVAAGIAGALVFLTDVLLRRIKSLDGSDFIKVLTVLMISNIIVTTINTPILMYFFPALAKLGFIVFYIPRLIQEIISTVLQSFVISYLMKIYSRIS